MKDIVHISRKKLLAALQKHDEMVSEDPFWQEEMARFEKFHQQEKLRRDNEFALKSALEKPTNREDE